MPAQDPHGALARAGQVRGRMHPRSRTDTPPIARQAGRLSVTVAVACTAPKTSCANNRARATIVIESAWPQATGRAHARRRRHPRAGRPARGLATAPAEYRAAPTQPVALQFSRKRSRRAAQGLCVSTGRCPDVILTNDEIEVACRRALVGEAVGCLGGRSGARLEAVAADSHG